MMSPDVSAPITFRIPIGLIFFAKLNFAIPNNPRQQLAQQNCSLPDPDCFQPGIAHLVLWAKLTLSQLLHNTFDKNLCVFVPLWWKMINHKIPLDQTIDQSSDCTIVRFQYRHYLLRRFRRCSPHRLIDRYLRFHLPAQYWDQLGALSYDPGLFQYSD